MSAVPLPPELAQFAADAVAAGHYRDTADVMRAGVALLMDRDQARAELLASVLAAKAEGERRGYLSADEVAAHVRDTIARIPSAPD